MLARQVSLRDIILVYVGEHASRMSGDVEMRGLRKEELGIGFGFLRGHLGQETCLDLDDTGLMRDKCTAVDDFDHLRRLIRVALRLRPCFAL